MRFLPLFLLLLGTSLLAKAQTKADLWVVAKEDGWSIPHKVQKGETLFSISRKYHVPPAIMADANGLTYQDGLKESSSVSVPVGAYNLLSARPAAGSETRPLYYKVRPEDNLYRISRQANVSQRTLQDWNQLAGNAVQPGQTLLVGWVLYDATPVAAMTGTTPAPTGMRTSQSTPTGSPAAATGSPATRPPVNTPKVIYDTPKYLMHPAPPDTMVRTPSDSRPGPAPGSMEEEFNFQTQEGKNLVTERGAAAFYTLTSKAKGAAAYAFHNTAARGTVIKVRNINNGRYVFVKVLGPLPQTKQYYNAIIGLSNAAQAALGVRDSKAFCELSYGGY